MKSILRLNTDQEMHVQVRQHGPVYQIQVLYECHEDVHVQLYPEHLLVSKHEQMCMHPLKNSKIS